MSFMRLSMPPDKRPLAHYLSAIFLFTLLAFGLLAPAHATQLKGRLEWVHKVELRIQENGIIEKVNVNVGQHVKKGDVLLKMNQRVFKAKLLKAQAMVARAKISTEDAKRELDRSQELFDRGLIAEEELKDAELKQAAAVADEETAKAEQAVAEVELGYSELRAPFDAIILNRTVWSGGVVYKTLQQTAPITLAPSGQMLARVLVSADVLDRYREGQQAQVSFRGKTYNGSIYSLGVESVRIEPNGAVYELDVLFKIPDGNTFREAEVVLVNLP